MTRPNFRAAGNPFLMASIVTACFAGCPRPAPRAPSPLQAEIAVDREGNRVIVGGFRARLAIGDVSLESAGGTDIFVAKIKRDGTAVWPPLRFGGPGDEGATSVALDGQGDIIVGGTFQEPLALGEHWVRAAIREQTAHGLFVAKLAGGSGKVLWASVIGTADRPARISVAVGADNSIVVGAALAGALEQDGQLTRLMGESVAIRELDAQGAVSLGALSGLARGPGGGAQPNVTWPSCAHSACAAGDALASSCDPACVAFICSTKNASCCDGTHPTGAWTALGCVAWVTAANGCNKRCDCNFCTTSTNGMYFNSCPPSSTCAANVCQHDSYCCTNAWDWICVSEVHTYCGITC